MESDCQLLGMHWNEMDSEQKYVWTRYNESMLYGNVNANHGPWNYTRLSTVEMKI